MIKLVLIFKLSFNLNGQKLKLQYLEARGSIFQDYDN